MHSIDVSPLADRFQFDAAVRSRSWEWLLALRRRLNVDLQILDDAQAPLLTLAGSPATQGIEALLAAGVPGLRLAISTAVRTRTPQAASVDRVQVVIVPVTMGRVVGGALVVARRMADDVPPERVRGELELVGFWLATAIEAHLLSPPATERDLDRLSSLCRLLGDASVHGSDREIVAAFAETLAIWQDLEVYGYVETPRGDFVREVSLAGADPSRSPAVIPRASLPESAQVTRLTRPDIERVGFSTGQDLVMTRSGEGAGSWLIAIAGTIAAHGLTRLSLYLSLLDQSVGRAIDASTAHVIAGMATHLLDDSHEPEEQGRQAVHHLQQALAMSSAALTVTTRTGVPLVQVGSPPSPDTQDAGDGGRVVIVRRAPRQYSMALVGGWAPGHRVTRQENRVTEAAADLLESWVRRISRQSQHGAERRGAAQGFDEVLERFARQAADGGVPVTAVVLSFGDAIFRPDVTQSRIGRLREHLRPGDLVGRLGDGEIGVLLHNTGGGQADALIGRLRQLLEGGEESVPMPVSIGVATRDPGESTVSALAQQARQNAVSHASGH